MDLFPGRNAPYPRRRRRFRAGLSGNFVGVLGEDSVDCQEVSGSLSVGCSGRGIVGRRQRVSCVSGRRRPGRSAPVFVCPAGVGRAWCCDVGPFFGWRVATAGRLLVGQGRCWAPTVIRLRRVWLRGCVLCGAWRGFSVVLAGPTWPARLTWPAKRRPGHGCRAAREAARCPRTTHPRCPTGRPRRRRPPPRDPPASNQPRAHESAATASCDGAASPTLDDAHAHAGTRHDSQNNCEPCSDLASPRDRPW